VDEGIHDGGIQKPILTGRAWKVDMEVHMHFPAIWRMDSVQSLQRDSVAQSDHTTAGRSQTRILTGKVWKASLEFEQLFGVLHSAEEAEIAWCTSQGSVLLNATILHLDGARRKF